MANYQSVHTAEETIPCSPEKFELLQRLLEAPYEDEEPERAALWEKEGCEYHGFKVKYQHGKAVYLSADDGSAEDLPSDFRKAFGEVIKEAGKEYLEVGWAGTSDQTRPGSHYGGEWRLNTDGSIEFAKLVYTSDMRKLPLWVSGLIPSDGGAKLDVSISRRKAFLDLLKWLHQDSDEVNPNVTVTDEHLEEAIGKYSSVQPWTLDGPTVEFSFEEPQPRSESAAPKPQVPEEVDFSL